MESKPPSDKENPPPKKKDGVVLSEQGEAVDLVLGDQWTLWLDNGGVRRTKEDYEKGTVEVRTVKTAREFWKCWNQLARLMAPLRQRSERDERGVEATEKCNICVFRKGIRPSWEDPANTSGGSWTLKVPRSVSDSVATTVVCEVIGGQVPIKPVVPGEEPICGVFIRVRPNVIAIDVWNRFTEPEEVLQKVKDHFNHVISEIKLPTPVLLPTVVFTPHDSPNKRCSSHMSSHLTLSSSSSDLRSYLKNGARKPSSGSSSPSTPCSPLNPEPSSPLHLRTASSGVSQSPSRRRTHAARKTSLHVRGDGLSNTQSSDDFLAAGDTSAAAATIRLPNTGASAALLTTELNDHIKSASVGDPNSARSDLHNSRFGPVVAQPSSVSFQNHMRKSSGLQQALPLLLRQGYAVPFAAYKDLVQEQTFSETVPGSAEAQKCEEHLRKSSISSAKYSPTISALPPDVIGHRRAFSLDRTTLDAAYSRYAQAKQAAYLRDKELERQEQLLKQQPATAPYYSHEWNKNMSQEPIPGLGTVGDGSGLFASLNSVGIARSPLAASCSIPSSVSDESTLCGIPGTGAASSTTNDGCNDQGWMSLLPKTDNTVPEEGNNALPDTTDETLEREEEKIVEDESEICESEQKPNEEVEGKEVVKEESDVSWDDYALWRHPLAILIAIVILQFILVPILILFLMQ